MSKIKTKIKMTLEDVKRIIDENDNVIVEEEVFKKSEIGKALKKGNLEHDAIAYIHKNVTNWAIKYFLFKHIGLSYGEACSCGLLKSVDYGNEWCEILEQMEGFFSSKEDLIEFVKKEFSIDLDSEEVLFGNVKNPASFCIFAKGIVVIESRSFFLNVKKGEKAKLNRQVYLDSLECIIRINQYYRYLKFNLEDPKRDVENALLEMSSDFWAIDYNVIKAYMEKNNMSNIVKTRVLMRIAHIGFNTSPRMLYSFDSTTSFIRDIIMSIKELNPSFPFAHPTQTGIGKRIYSNFAYSLFIFSYNTSNTNLDFKEDDLNFLYENIFGELLGDKSVVKEIQNSDYIEKFCSSCFHTVRKENLNSLFNMCLKTFGEENTLNSLVGLSISNDKFYPTEEMAEKIIDASVNWSTILVPENRMYDMEYMLKIAEKVGINSGLIFGCSRSTRNRFFPSRMEVDKIPKEFIEKYESKISWDLVSCYSNISLEFLKEHKEKLNFEIMVNKTYALIDDELAQWILDEIAKENDNSYYRIQPILSSKSLSLNFIAKNIMKLNSRPGTRNVKATLSKIKLEELLNVLE